MSVQKKITAVLLVFTVFCFAMEIFRMGRTWNHAYIFLLWNLILAWIPYLLSLRFRDYDMHRQKFRAVAVLLLWILFLPNAPYIITDLLHLRQRELIPFWFDVMLSSSFAWLGLLLALLSVRNVHHKLQEHVPDLVLWPALMLLFISAGYGIYLGRFLRWNSWDIFLMPVYMAHHALLDLVHPFHHPRPLLVTAVISILLSFSYAIFYLIGQKNTSHETR